MERLNASAESQIRKKSEAGSQIAKSRRHNMNLLNSICGFIEDSQSEPKKEKNNDIDDNFSENSKEKYSEFAEQLSPRDGMSAESAKFLIDKCANNKTHKISGIENKGRYFTAKVLNQKGNVINELLVDKLNGHVKFIR
jgi:hypothetical protein